MIAFGCSIDGFSGLPLRPDSAGNGLNPCKANLNIRAMADFIDSVTLPPANDPQREREWLRTALHQWLDREFPPEAVNADIAARASQVFMRHRMEGEDDLGSLLMAVLTEMQSFDFSESFYGEFAIANAVSDLLLDSMGIDHCCGAG